MISVFWLVKVYLISGSWRKKILSRVNERPSRVGLIQPFIRGVIHSRFDAISLTINEVLEALAMAVPSAVY